MGVYAFDTGFLIDLLEKDAADRSSHDFGRDVIPGALGTAGCMPIASRRAASTWSATGRTGAT